MSDLISPQGQLVTIPDEQVDQAMQQGYTTQATAPPTQNSGAALADAFARGLTGGASDLFLTNEVGIKPEAIQRHLSEHPYISAAGQIAGNIATLGVLPGASEAAPGLSRLAFQTGEGAALGAQNLVTDKALGDPDINAQKVLATLGLGAVLGGAAGKLADSFAPEVSDASSKLSDSLKAIEPEAPAGEPTDTTFSGRFQRGLAGLPEKDIDTRVRDLTTNMQSILDTSKQAVSDLYKNALDTHLQTGLKDMSVDAAKAAVAPSLEKIDAVTTELSDPAYSQTARKILSNRTDDLKEQLDNSTSAIQVYKATDKFVKDISGGGGLIDWGAIPSLQDRATQDLLRGLNRSMRNDLASPEIWGQEVGTNYKSVADLYAETAEARRNFQKEFTTKTGAGDRVINSSKINSFFKNIDKPVKDSAHEALDQFVDASQKVAKASENYAGFSAAKGSLADKFTQLAKENETMGRVAEAIARDKSPHLPFGLEKFNPYTAGLTLHHSIEGVKAVGRIISDVGGKISYAAKSSFNASKEAPTIIMSPSRFSKIVDSIRELGNPSSLMNSMQKNIGPLRDSLPNIAPKLQSTVQTGLAFLSSKIPGAPNNYPLDAEWKPSPSEISEFARYYDAVENPLDALRQVKNGTLSNQTMEALQAVYPGLLREMRMAALEHMKQPSNYASKIALAKFMGEPLDSQQSPQSIQAAQAAINAPMAPQQGQKTTLGGLKQLTLGKRSQSRVERLLGDQE